MGRVTWRSGFAGRGVDLLLSDEQQAGLEMQIQDFTLQEVTLLPGGGKVDHIGLPLPDPTLPDPTNQSQNDWIEISQHLGGSMPNAIPHPSSTLPQPCHLLPGFRIFLQN